MFRASSCPSSGAYQLQQQPLVYRRNVMVAELLVVVGINSFECMKMLGLTNPKHISSRIGRSLKEIIGYLLKSWIGL
jgi:hypothetical protein